MIKAVIFDCFGVLTTDGWLPFKEQHFGHDQALFAEATDLNKRADAGLITYGEFITGIADLAKVSPKETHSAVENNIPNKPLFAWIQKLKSDYAIGMLSNAADDWLEELFRPEQVLLFDAVSLSCETRFVKPDARAYESIATRLQVPMDECVLIDDQERYCTGAREAGMQAIWYKDVEQCQADFEKLINS